MYYEVERIPANFPYLSYISRLKFIIKVDISGTLFTELTVYEFKVPVPLSMSPGGFNFYVWMFGVRDALKIIPYTIPPLQRKKGTYCILIIYTLFRGHIQCS